MGRSFSFVGVWSLCGMNLVLFLYLIFWCKTMDGSDAPVEIMERRPGDIVLYY